MNGFIDEYWENLWTGWTPIVVVLFFLMSIKLGGWMSGYFVNKGIWFFTKFVMPLLLAGLVPIFSQMAKSK